MGSLSGGGGGSSAESKSSSTTSLSSLAKAQEDVVRGNYKIFNDYFLPEYKELYESLSPDSAAGKAQMGLTAQEINNSFDAAQKQTAQNLAQRNITQAGAGLALLAANNRARSSALANAYANQQANSNNNKTNMLSLLGQLMPHPTSAAPTISESWSKGSSSSANASGGGSLA